jgi:hypothetical protein
VRKCMNDDKNANCHRTLHGSRGFRGSSWANGVKTGDVVVKIPHMIKTCSKRVMHLLGTRAGANAEGHEAVCLFEVASAS